MLTVNPIYLSLEGIIAITSVVAEYGNGLPPTVHSLKYRLSIGAGAETFIFVFNCVAMFNYF